MNKKWILTFWVAMVLVLIIIISRKPEEIPFDQLEKRKGIYYVMNEKEPFTGTAITRYKDGKKKKRIILKKGQEHGECTGWYDNGQKQYQYQYREGKKHGNEIHWSKDGEKKIGVSFADGKLDKKWIQWYKNGKKKEEIEFVQDQKHGEWSVWYESGMLKYQGAFHKWKYHGTFIDWYKSGRKKFERSANMGIPEGEWIKWYSDSTKKAEGEWIQGRPQGTWIEYYKNGKKKEIIYFKNGKRHGKWTQWYPNGNKKLAGEWNDGEISGQWKVWSIGGTSVKLETFPFFKAVYYFYLKAKENNAAGKHTDSPFTSDGKNLSELQLKTLNSLRKIDDYPLYVMDYFGDYNLDNFLGNFDGMKEDPTLFLNIKDKNREKECSTFFASGESGRCILGRNQDTINHVPAMLLFTRPVGRYASVSLLDVRNTWIRKGNLHTLPLKERALLLNAPFWPHDGMNECGLAIGHMTVEGERVYNPTKVTIHGMRAIRMVLDYAKNVEEAVQLLENFNIFRSEEGHFLISDASGQSAVIEYLDGKMLVMRNREPWQVATNFIINRNSPSEIGHICKRYSTAYRILKRSNGRISRTEAMKILKRISMYDNFKTQWSVVYNLNTGKVDLVIGRNYRNIMSFFVPKSKN